MSELNGLRACKGMGNMLKIIKVEVWDYAYEFACGQRAITSSRRWRRWGISMLNYRSSQFSLFSNLFTLTTQAAIDPKRPPRQRHDGSACYAVGTII